MCGLQYEMSNSCVYCGLGPNKKSGHAQLLPCMTCDSAFHLQCARSHGLTASSKNSASYQCSRCLRNGRSPSKSPMKKAKVGWFWWPVCYLHWWLYVANLGQPASGRLSSQLQRLNECESGGCGTGCATLTWRDWVAFLPSFLSVFTEDSVHLLSLYMDGFTSA